VTETRGPAGSDESDRTALIPELIDLIYEAAVDAHRWQDVADTLSAAMRGHSVTIWILMPGARRQSEVYRSVRHDVPDDVFERHYTGSTPWGNVLPTKGPETETTDRFVRMESLVSLDELGRSAYYSDWMAPRGFAVGHPYVLTLAQQVGRPTSAVILFNMQGLPPITTEDLAFADQLAPHFKRAHRILDQLRAMRREQDVFREVIDRIPSGIVLVDEEGRVVAMNESARDSVDP